MGVNQAITAKDWESAAEFIHTYLSFDQSTLEILFSPEHGAETFFVGLSSSNFDVQMINVEGFV